MKIVTFNIRCDFDQDGVNSFRYRKELILSKIAAEQPDIIGFQEVLPHVALWLVQELKDYYVIGCGRSETLEDEQCSIAFRKDRLNLIQMETWWLSPEPMVPASRYEQQSICPRVATEAVFMERESGRVFRMVNTHLDHIGSEARRLGMDQILRKLDTETLFPDAPVIIMGDMNAEPDSPEIKMVADRGDYTDLTEGIGVTYHGFEADDETECIDYIFVKGFREDKKAVRWTDKEGEVYLSDHYPVCAEIS